MAIPKARSAKRRKSATTARRKPKPGSVTISRSKITFSLAPKEIARAKQCLERTGAIRIGFKELRVTKLPTTLDDGKLID